MNEIANRFKYIRESRGLDKSAMAAELGENRQKIADIESGKQRITQDVLVKLIEKFFIDSNWLMTGIGSMYRNQVKEQSPTYQVKSIKDLEGLFDRVDTLEQQVSELKKQA